MNTTFHNKLFSSRGILVAGGLLLLVTVLAYIPTFSAGYIWDDDDYVTENPTLRAPDGLLKIWLEPSASPQYYPLVFTTFWVEHQIWGLSPTGYHVINVLLHGLCALVLWRLLCRIGIPWPAAWVAAAVFALHPVHVESVAWVTERKNVLSGLFYLSAALAYQGFRPALPTAKTWRRPMLAYVVTIVLFFAALLSKSVTASLPAALLLVSWWRRGRIEKQDIAPLLPMLLLGLVMGLSTATMEREHVGTSILVEHGELELAPSDRLLVAGRALWFYAGSLVWPSNLTFNYPRWTIDASQPAQWFFPCSVLAVVALLWAVRRRIGRGALTAVLFSAGTLVPALGFFDVFPFRYSWVADHFQYLASIGLITGAVVAASQLITSRRNQVSVRTVTAVTSILLLVLATLTWRQSQVFHDAETLWRDTIRKNPTSWIAHMHLGGIEQQAGALDTALSHYEIVARVSPRYPFAHFRVAEILEQRDGADAALTALRKASSAPEAHGMVLARYADQLLAHGEESAALAPAREGTLHAPGYQYTHEVAGRAALALELHDEAVRHFLSALMISPGNASNRAALGRSFYALGRHEEAFSEWATAISLNPRDNDTRIELGRGLIMAGRIAEGVPYLSVASIHRPKDTLLRFDHGVGRALLGQMEDARKEAESALELARQGDDQHLIPQIEHFIARLDAAPAQTPADEVQP